jgi:translation initiation factor 3 subunit J
VADNWEEAEDSEAKREKAAKAAAAKVKADAEAAANKKSKSQRVEEHREAARRRRAAEEEEDDESSDDEDEAEKRARLRQTEQDADLKHAQDLFDNVGLGPKSRTAPNKAAIIEDKSNPGRAIDLSTLGLFKPATKSQFEALTTALVPLLTSATNKPHYSLWLQDFVKKIAADLPSTEIKKAASGLTALSNEKMKEEKAMEKGGKKTKAAKSKISLAAGRDVGRGVADTTSYEVDLGDEDFM